MSPLVALVMLPLLLCRCAGDAPDTPAPRAQMPAERYRVQIGDMLDVRLYLAPDLDEDVTVRPDGRITTILAQSVPAAGRTPDEIAGDLRTVYAHELKDPQLTVGVKTPSPARVFVTGEVIYPGEQDTAGAPLTLLQAVAKAGGLRPTGDQSHVFILRHGTGDKAIVLSTNYHGAATGRDPAADVSLAPFDVVYVPKSGISRVYLWFNQHFQQFVPVNWGFSYNVNPVVNNNR